MGDGPGNPAFNTPFNTLSTRVAVGYSALTRLLTHPLSVRVAVGNLRVLQWARKHPSTHPLTRPETGVGKGRQIAGIVMENFLRGRKKAVWVSVGPDLLEDARRDLRDIGAGAIQVHDLRHWDASKKLSAVNTCQTGVLFST